MNLFTPYNPVGWSRDDEGIAVFFKKPADHQRASIGRGSPVITRIYYHFQRLLECGDANVETSTGGIYLPAEDAVRLDPETREIFYLPPVWPGYFQLDTLSIPNLHDFDAVLRLIDVNGRAVPSWCLKGAILEVGNDRYLPDAAQFTCLMAFNPKSEVGHDSAGAIGQVVYI